MATLMGKTTTSTSSTRRIKKSKKEKSARPENRPENSYNARLDPVRAYVCLQKYRAET
jgi:hypothetical protein